MSIAQSGAQAVITLNDGHATTMDATVDGSTLTAKSLITRIAGDPGARRLEGAMSFTGCAPVAFRAVRQAAKKRGA